MINLKKLLGRILGYPAYKVTAIEQDEHSNYVVTIQITRNGLCFTSTPEKILSSDRLTDKFSQRDIRTLTYLGYLEINSPKYKIMAKKLAENDKLLLVLYEKKKNKLETRSASDIAKDEDAIKQFDSSDAHFIGYIQAMEDLENEKLKLKEKKIINTQNYPMRVLIEISDSSKELLMLDFIIDNEMVKYKIANTQDAEFTILEGDISAKNGELYKAIINNSATDLSASSKQSILDQISRKNLMELVNKRS